MHARTHSLNIPHGDFVQAAIAEAMNKAISRPPGNFSAQEQEAARRVIAANKPLQSESWTDYVQKTMQREREIAIMNQQNRFIQIRQNEQNQMASYVQPQPPNLQDLIESQIAARNAQIKHDYYMQKQPQHPLSERSHSSKFQAILKNEADSRQISGLAPTVTQISAPSASEMSKQ